MRATLEPCIFVLAFFAAVSAVGQTAPAANGDPQELMQVPEAAATVSAAPEVLATGTAAGEAKLPAPTVQELLDFRDSDVKFNLRDLVDVLSDRRHEGWVLAAYPDPKTSQPLIGAGFSLDLPAREHPQRDPLNPHPFIEPSSAQLWQTAGLDAQRLDGILEQFNRNLAVWNKKKFRKKIATLTPEITDDEANQLVRVAAIQAIYNAKGYCRNFDRYSASQQMALSQLVYQMGVNLAEFSQFLNLINSDSSVSPDSNMASSAEAEYWKAVQTSLIHSQWARLYRVRATAVIAMLDPQYSGAPALAERHVSATLRPAVVHRRRGRQSASMRTAAFSGHAAKSGRKKARARKN